MVQMIKRSNFKILDCTLRDGGYHNNWRFSRKLINAYLSCMSSQGIEFVELGFRFLNQNKLRGETAYTKENFIKKLKIPKNLSIGVMINASDFVNNSSPVSQLCKETFPKLKKSKIKFVRLACHYKEIFSIEPIINWLKRRNVVVTVNLMQISELNTKQLIKASSYLSKKRVDVLYIADSLGSVKPNQIINIIRLIKKNWKKELGIHAHDNLKQALKNTIKAKTLGTNWLDGTVLGMGRGPGNTKTEELLKALRIKNSSNFKHIYNLRNKFFNVLKKKYKWGTNKYYKFAALNKIHPTYIQEILSDTRYKKKNYQSILYNLKKSDSRKYNPFKLITPKNIYIGKPRGKWDPYKDILGKNVLIIGAGNSALRNKSKIEKFIRKNDLYIICLNTNKSINEKLINLRTACHPFRIISDISNYNSKTNLAMPLSMLPNEIFEKIKNKNKQIRDYGISTNLNNKIIVKKNYCVLPNSLAISYSLSIAIAGKSKKIFLAGFDGYDVDDSKNDETDLILKIVRKTYKKLKILSITKTKYKLKNYIS